MELDGLVVVDGVGDVEYVWGEVVGVELEVGGGFVEEGLGFLGDDVGVGGGRGVGWGEEGGDGGFGDWLGWFY